MTKVTPQPLSRQAVALGSISKGTIRETRVTAAVAYIHPRKARLELIAGTTDFEVMMGMGEIGAGRLGSEGWGELMQPSFRCL